MPYGNNELYTPEFLRQHIGRLVRVEFLIGTNNLTDRIGFLEDVGASYILLRSIESDNIIYCDIYAIKFITIAASSMYGSMNNSMMMPSMMNNPMINPMMNNRY